MSGKVVWASGKGMAGYATPVGLKVGDDQCLAIMSSGSLEVVRESDGKRICNYPWVTESGINAMDPLLAGSQILISSGYNHGAALLNLADGKLTKVWENKNLRAHFNSCILWNDYVFGLDDNQLRCLALRTGEVKWTDRAFGKGSIMMADGKLIGMSERGELIVAEPSPDEFKVIARAQILGGKCWTVPVLANGRIYCRNARGDVACLDVGGK
jgi:outer membrane protein assembly factor BamB